MAKSPNQKQKLLYMMKFFLEKSDEQHPVTVAQIIDYLAANDISAERKSIYDDIETLRSFGMDIEVIRGKSTGYYVGERDFQLAELKLLVDSVQSSKFITGKKTKELIKKIEGLASEYDRRLLDRQVYVRNRVKTMSENVYYNIDEISNAINTDRVINFYYFEYTPKKERVYRHGGRLYEVSPFALIWDDENYYLLAYDAEADKLKHYRVDKMKSVTRTDASRQGKKLFEKIDMSAYSSKVFEMFSGEARTVRLRFANHLAGAVIDRFGKDVMMIPDGDGWFTVTLELVVSRRFFGWLFGFGEEAKILYPPDVIDDMRATLKKVSEEYGNC